MDLIGKLGFKRFRTRVWFILSAVYILSALLIVSVLFQSFRSDLLQSTASQIDHRFALIEQELGSYRYTAEQHASLLAKSPELENLTKLALVNEVLTEDATKGVEQIFSALLNTYAECFQARLISARSGMELVRLNRDASGVSIVPKAQLQNKSDRPYYQEALLLNEGEFYTSSFDLNKEFGKLSTPYIKTLRVATPLFLNKEKVAILVLNMDAKQWFSDLNSYGNISDQLYLIDPESGFIIHPDDEKAFSGFKPNTTLSDFDSLLLSMIHWESSDLFLETYAANKHWLVRTKPLTLGEDELVLMSSMEKGLLFEAARKDTRTAFMFILLALGGGVFVLLWLSELIVRPITRLTDRVVELKPGELLEPITDDEESDDEFSRLGRSFAEMTIRVNDQIGQLRKAQTKAEQALKSKDEFLGNVSHEIRTPLNTISGMTEALKHQNLDDKQRSVVDTLAYSVEHLLSMINDILDYNQALEGQLKLHKVVFSTEELAKNACLGFTMTGRHDGVELRYEIDSNVPQFVKADRVRITQIIHNLIGNALKFTDKGFVDLKLSYNDGLLILSVQDTGIGIPEEELPKVFERYGQASGSKGKSAGLGLGLSIVKHLVKLMKGRIEVASEVHKGTRFTIHIPAEEVELEELKATETIGKGDINVLYVDDVEVNRITMEHLIRSMGFHVSAIECCKDATELLQASTYSIVLMDLRMPEVDGFECIEILKKQYPHLPIIAVSANLAQEELNRLNALGVRNSVLKPIDQKELQTNILELVGEPGSSVYDHLLVDHCNHDVGLLRKVADSFGQLIDECIETVGMRDTVGSEMPGKLRHRLMPSAKMFGFDHLIDKEDDLEPEKFLLNLKEMRVQLDRFKNHHNL